MNRYIRIGFMAIVMLLALTSVAFCADYNNWGNTDTNQLLGREMPYDAIYAGAQRSGVSTMVSGSLAIPTSYALVIKAITQTATPLTLANGVPGQILTFQVSTMASGGAILTPTTCTGFTTITFDAAKEYVTLLYIDDTYGWILIGTNATIA